MKVLGLLILAIALAAVGFYLRFRPTLNTSEIVLRDLDGAVHGSIQDAETDVTALFFLGKACPVSRQYSPEIERLCSEYKSRSVGCFLVYPEPGLTDTTLKAHLKEFGLTAPAILDTRGDFVRYAKATVTPEAAVFSKSGNLLYRGRIDDRYLEPGHPRPAAQNHDLREALDAATNRKPIQNARTEAVGCFIETYDAAP